MASIVSGKSSKLFVLSAVVALGFVPVVFAQPEATQLAAHTYEVPCGFLPGHQPDSNSYILQGKHGLTVIDTGRHASHREKIEAAAKGLHQPVVAVINTHWHLDHVSGNPKLRAAYPGLKVYASAAIDDALTGFLPESAAQARQMIKDGKLSASQQEEVGVDLATIEHGAALKPDVVVDAGRDVTLGGLRLELHLAKDAATAGDVWVYDPATRVAFVGDLVTFPAPFMDTACSEGWSAALAEVAKTPFEKVAPGHGPVLSREGFTAYRAGFDGLVACAASAESVKECAVAWVDAVGPLAAMTEAERARGQGMAGYYVGEVLRKNGGDSKYCRNSQQGTVNREQPTANRGKTKG